MEIRFSYETKYGIFGDVLVLPNDHTYTNSEIEAMKEQRRDNWVAHIDSTQVSVADETANETTEPT